MVHGREAASGERGISHRFVPAHASHRMVSPTVRVASRFPGRGARPAGLIDEAGDRRLPRQRPSVLDERLLPVRTVAIPPAIDELLELPIGDFVTIDGKRADCGRELSDPGVLRPARAAGDRDHIGREPVFRRQGEAEVVLWRRHFERGVAGLGDPKPHRYRRHAAAGDRSGAERLPRRIRLAVWLPADVGARGSGGEGDHLRHLRPDRFQRRITPDVTFGLGRQPERGLILAAVRKPVGLGNGPTCPLLHSGPLQPPY